MLSEIFLLILVICLIIFLYFIFAKPLLSPELPQYSMGQACIGSNCFNVEFAETPAQRERGLMFRKELKKNEGMLFIFDKEAIYSIWMKNTLIPLDILWIDSNYKVVYISQGALPCKSLICPSIIPSSKAKYVLELNAGTCGEAGLGVGDEVHISVN